MTGRALRPRLYRSRILPRFLRDTFGSPLIEFALVAPLLVTMLIGAVDFGRYILLNQKLSRAASTLGDLLAREDVITSQDFPGIFAAADQIMAPFEIGDDGVLVLTIAAVDTDGTSRVVNRQQSPASATLAGRFGSVGDVLTGAPDGLLVSIGDVLIIAEVRYRYSAWMFDILKDNDDLYYVTFFRPRA